MRVRRCLSDLLFRRFAAADVRPERSLRSVTTTIPAARTGPGMCCNAGVPLRLSLLPPAGCSAKPLQLNVVVQYNRSRAPRRRAGLSGLRLSPDGAQARGDRSRACPSLRTRDPPGSAAVRPGGALVARRAPPLKSPGHSRTMSISAALEDVSRSYRGSLRTPAPPRGRPRCGSITSTGASQEREQSHPTRAGRSDCAAAVESQRSSVVTLALERLVRPINLEPRR